MLKTDARGFTVYDEFTDAYEANITVKESSSVTPRVWVFVLGGESGHNDGHIHLDVEGAGRLIAALQEWKDAQET